MSTHDDKKVLQRLVALLDYKLKMDILYEEWHEALDRSVEIHYTPIVEPESSVDWALPSPPSDEGPA